MDGPMYSQYVHRASYPFSTTVENMGVDHGRFDASVAQQFLHGPDVIPRRWRKLTHLC